MKTFFLGFLSALSVQLPAHAAGSVFVSEIRGTINPAVAEYLEKSIEKAEAANATALIVELDTPGGLVSSVQSMSQAIDQAKIPVVVYVTPAGASATSAGALLMLASHVGALTPGTHMGAAHPVDSSGKDIQGAMGQKALNDTVAFAQGLAELRGRNRELAGDIVAKSASFTSKEATSKGLAEIEADQLSSLLIALEGREVKVMGAQGARVTTKIASAGARVESIEMTWGQKLLHQLSNPNIAAILMSIGMLLIYLELKSPGVQVAGILGATMVIISFMSFQTLPIRTGALSLMALGLLGMIGEAFAAAHGLLALGGVVSFVLGLVWIVDPAQLSLGVSPAVWVPVAISMGGATLAIGWFAARVKLQVAAARATIGGGQQAGLSGYRATVESLDGTAMMSPFGKVYVRGELWDFVSEDSVKVGDEIEIIEVRGLKVFAKKVVNVSST